MILKEVRRAHDDKKGAIGVGWFVLCTRNKVTAEVMLKFTF